MAESTRRGRSRISAAARRQTLFLTAAIATASFMEILDMTIVNVSVPCDFRQSRRQHLRRHLGRQLVHARRGGHAAADGLDRPALRRGAHLRHLDSAVHAVLRDLRAGNQPADAGDGAADPGPGLRPDDVGRTGHSAAQLSGIERRGMAIALWSMVIIIAPISGRSSAAGSRTTCPGPGCSTSICRSAPLRRRVLVDPAHRESKLVKLADRRRRSHAAGHRRSAACSSCSTTATTWIGSIPR
jgi:hypothetical protein